MNADGIAILENLDQVEALRKRRAADAAQRERVEAVKRFQHARFERTYRDLLSGGSRAAAARFFLEELYGPHDFSARDAQFARIVPGLVRVFPPEIVTTVRTLSELHALSERLDDALATHLSGPAITLADYRAAWRATAEPAAREHQVDLMLQVGSALHRYTRNPMLRGSLRLMRTPARLAGLAVLQQFLEGGFDTFKDLPDPPGFLQLIAGRERELISWLYSDAQTAAPHGIESA
jgi:hypothetical protein